MNYFLSNKVRLMVNAGVSYNYHDYESYVIGQPLPTIYQNDSKNFVASLGASITAALY